MSVTSYINKCVNKWIAKLKMKTKIYITFNAHKHIITETAWVQAQKEMEIGPGCRIKGKTQVINLQCYS